VDKLTPARRSWVMARIRGSDTGPELLVRSIVHRLGYRYRLHDRRLPGSPDLVFPARKRVIFVHGCFWHGHSCRRGCLPSSNRGFWEEKIRRNKQRDRRVGRLLKRDDWEVLTVWQCQMKNPSKLEKRLTSFLERDKLIDR